MWRAALLLSDGAVELEPGDVPRLLARPRRRLRRSGEAERHRLVTELRSVSRRAATPPRARRFEVLLCDRAMTVRPEILEIAAALERAAEPSPRTVRALRQLLRDGCTSPLYNRAIPVERLWTVLAQIRVELESCEPRIPADEGGIPAQV
jgi:hypothetical protein